MRLERAFQHLMALFVAALLVVTLAIAVRYDLLRSLRLDALVAAWWMAAYERPLLLSDTETHRYCGMVGS